VTEQAKRFARADAVEVIRASPHRVEPACPVAGAGGCGGCDWQHARLDYQRRLKEMVVAEQLRRLAGIERTVEVEPVAGGGLGWRTRVRFAVDAAGRAGFRKARSHEVVPVTHCPIAHPLVEAAGVEATPWNRTSEIEVAASASSGNWLVRTKGSRDGRLRIHGGHRGDPGDQLVERTGGRTFRISPGGFWQVHPAAPAVLTGAVLDGLRVRLGERALDLYCGVGLFAAAVAQAVGQTGSVRAVESSRQAAEDAAHNLRDLPQVQVVRAATADALTQLRESVDLVVLDPPRSGAGAVVVAELCRLRPRAIAYVSCDPASLARDLATFARHDYGLNALRAFDLFPQTQHVECVAMVRPGRST
jgi:tRNA/tmRNA/rRNA uracil-C5-methylase (TrmA/RlmC/RlmD family)